MSRFLKKEKRKQERGITLIALITTIIVLLILAGISIGAITGSNGIIGQAQSAKEETEISQEKEIIDISTVEAIGKNNRGNLEEEEFQNALNSHTNGNVEVSTSGEEFEVFFEETNRYYTVDKDGNIIDYDIAIIDKSPGDIKKDENGNNIPEGQPLEIWCIEDLVEWSNNYNSYAGSNIVLCRTLDFNSNLSYSNGKMLGCNSIEELKELLTDKSGEGFTPIGSFAGTFNANYEGKNNKIENIYINLEENDVGLFKWLYGRVLNLSISGEISGINNVGGIAGDSEGCTIDNCSNYATIIGNPTKGATSVGTGGIIGKGVGTITNTYNAGEIKLETSESYSSIGGIIGVYTRWAMRIENCYNIGDISGISTGGIGGIMGNTGAQWTEEYIINTYNLGKIESRNTKGEIIGIVHSAATVNLDNVYYKNGDIDLVGNKAGTLVGEGEVLEESYMRSEQFVEKLNSYKSEDNSYPTNWKKWTLGEEGYPTLVQN